jgi:hypothetical protein
MANKLCRATGAQVGNVVSLEILPVENEPEPRLPTDLPKRWHPLQRPGWCRPTSRPLLAETGSTGSRPPSSRRLAPVVSKTPARCSPEENGTYAASTARRCNRCSSVFQSLRFRPSFGADRGTKEGSRSSVMLLGHRQCYATAVSFFMSVPLGLEK